MMEAWWYIRKLRILEIFLTSKQHPFYYLCRVRNVTALVRTHLSCLGFYTPFEDTVGERQ